MAIPEQKRWRHTGRKSGPSFIQIPHFVLESPQWGRMDALAVKLLMELVRQYKGNNNGDLSATTEMLKGRSSSWASKDTLPKKLRWLEDHGWIVRTRQGGRHIGCNLYAVTFWPIDACNKHTAAPERKPSHLWKNATGTPPGGERNPVPRGARPLTPRRAGSKQGRPHLQLVDSA
jgi:hypothetical protein